LTSEPAPAAEPIGAQLQGERRRATVILADVKGSTALAERVDVETWVEIMNRVFQILGAEIYRYGGEINQYRGDGLVAFFGLPAAHEDDPERAVLAALAMQDAVKRYAAELAESQGIELLLRVGINTGEVIAASVGDSRQHSEETAMGRAIALAARMETASEPGTVLATENTYRLVAPLFEWQALGEITVKGVSQPLAVYRPLAPCAAPGRGRGIAGVETPLVGRDAEFRALQAAIERLQSGAGGIVTVVGEAGIGKSRLVTEIRTLALSTSKGSGNLESANLGGGPLPFLRYDSGLPDLAGHGPQAARGRARRAVVRRPRRAGALGARPESRPLHGRLPVHSAHAVTVVGRGDRGPTARTGSTGTAGVYL
jgi:class 3 adenylate cyclase